MKESCLPANQAPANSAAVPSLAAELLKPGPAPDGWLSPTCELGLVSVVIPTYNRAHLIGETLASILAQTYGKIEVMMADDGSTDGTLAVMSEWRERFRKERGWELRILQQAHKGVCAARNLGAMHCRGETIKFFDDDDLMSHNLIAAQRQALKATGAELVYGSFRIFYESRGGYLLGEPKRIKAPDGDFLRGWLSKGGGAATWACLMTRELLGRTGPWAEDLPRANDAEFLARCVIQAKGVSYCGEGMVFWRRHRKTISSPTSLGKPEHSLRYLKVIEAHLSRTGQTAAYRKELASRYRWFGSYCYRLGAIGMGNEYADKAFALQPKYAPQRGWLRKKLYAMGHYRLGLWLKSMGDRREQWASLLGTLGLGLFLRDYTRVPSLPVVCQPAQAGTAAASLADAGSTGGRQVP